MKRLSYGIRRANLARALAKIRRGQFSAQHPRDAASLAVLGIVAAVLHRVESAVAAGDTVTMWREAFDRGDLVVVAWADELLSGELRGSKTVERGLAEIGGAPCKR